VIRISRHWEFFFCGKETSLKHEVRESERMRK
jgi:hypothetical protein